MKYDSLNTKLINIKDKCINFIDKNIIVILSFFIIFILLIVQHSVISLYFDDYGNASLSYSYVVPDVAGTDFSLSQLFEWAYNIYQNWGGRILYAVCFIIPLLRNGITSYMMFQSIVILGIFYFIYKIVCIKFNNKKYIWIIPISEFILYSNINMIYLRHGIFWASASVLYIWPLLPLFAFIYLYMSNGDKIKQEQKIKHYVVIPLMLVLNFFATFSQEQIGIAVIAFEICYIILHHIKYQKKYLLIDIPNLIVSIVSYLFLFLAPGNWVRMDSNVEFASLTFLDKIKLNLPIIFNNIFKNEIRIYIYILIILTIYMSFVVIKNKYRNNKTYLLLLIPVIISLFEIFILYFYSRFDFKFIYYLFGALWLISIFIVSIFYYIQKNNIEFCALYITAMCSILCLVMSPSLIERTYLPFIFVLIIIICNISIDMVIDNKVFFKMIFIISFIVISIKGCNSYIRNYIGYRDNFVIFKVNNMILKKYSGSKDVSQITLYKVKDIWYGSEQPYIVDMDYWIKEYYDIPQMVEFIWNDIYEEIR